MVIQYDSSRGKRDEVKIPLKEFLKSWLEDPSDEIYLVLSKKYSLENNRHCLVLSYRTKWK